jgi:hypothetical protein
VVVPAVAILIDTSRTLRRPVDLLELVNAIVAALPTDEAEWIEWKGTLPLDAAEGWFAISKAIIGLANRHPDHAARSLEGTGYLVVGAEPGNVRGVTSVDGAKLDDWLRAYLGENGPMWAPTYVTLNGREVLVVVVELPEWGDPIHSLRKTYQPAQGKGADSGTVFARGKAGTRRATAPDMDMLQERLLRRNQKPVLDLRLHWVGNPVTLTPINLTPEARQSWLDARRGASKRDFEGALEEQAAARLKALDVTTMADMWATAAQRRTELLSSTWPRWRNISMTSKGAG